MDQSERVRQRGMGGCGLHRWASRAVIMIAQDWKDECDTYEHTEQEGT